MSLIMASRFTDCKPTMAHAMGMNFVAGSGCQVVRIDLTLDDPFTSGSWTLTINGTTLAAVTADATMSNVGDFVGNIEDSAALKYVIECRVHYVNNSGVRSTVMWLVARKTDTSFTYSMATSGDVGFSDTLVSEAEAAEFASTSGLWGGSVEDGASFVGRMLPLTTIKEHTFGDGGLLYPYKDVTDNGWKYLTGIKVTGSEYNSAADNTLKVQILNYDDDALGGFCLKDGSLFVAFGWKCGMWSTNRTEYPLLTVKLWNSQYSYATPLQTWNIPEDLSGFGDTGYGLTGPPRTVYLRISQDSIDTVQNNWSGVTEIEFQAAPFDLSESYLRCHNYTHWDPDGTSGLLGPWVSSEAGICRPESTVETPTNCTIYNSFDESKPDATEFWQACMGWRGGGNPWKGWVAMGDGTGAAAELTIGLEKPAIEAQGWGIVGDEDDTDKPSRLINGTLMSDPEGDSNFKRLILCTNFSQSDPDLGHTYSEWPAQAAPGGIGVNWHLPPEGEEDHRSVTVTIMQGATVIKKLEVLGYGHAEGPKNDLVINNEIGEVRHYDLTPYDWTHMPISSAGQRSLRVKVECEGYGTDDYWGKQSSHFNVRFISFQSTDTAYQGILCPLPGKIGLHGLPGGGGPYGRRAYEGPVRLESQINVPYYTDDVPDVNVAWETYPPDEVDEPYTRNWGVGYLPLQHPGVGDDSDNMDMGYKANILAWSDAVFLNRNSYNRCYNVISNTSSVDETFEVLDAGQFTLNMKVSSEAGYIGTFLQPSTYRCLTFTLYYQKDAGGARRIDAWNWFQGDSDGNSGYAINVVDAAGNEILANLISGNYDTGPDSTRAANRNVYLQTQALPGSTTPVGGWVTNDYEGFDTGSFLYPNQFISYLSTEQNVSSEDGWTAVGGAFPQQILSQETDDSYIEIDAGETIVVGFSAPYIQYTRDFTEATSIGMDDSFRRDAYSFWSTATGANKKYVEVRMASVSADDCDLRVEWWFDPDRDPYYDSRLRNTSQCFDISDCPTWAFGEDGSPNGKATEAKWHTDDAVAGLTPTQQGQFRVMVRNVSTGSQKARVSVIRLQINPLSFAHVNFALSSLAFEPNVGQS